MLKYGANVALPVEQVDETTRLLRLAVCAACDRFDRNSRKCGECGCFMDVKAATKTHRNPKAGFRIEITHCPLGKWADGQISNFYKSNKTIPDVPEKIEP